jgi:hypothetical protein
VDELRGRLSWLRVNYPDMDIRLRPAIEVLDVLLSRPVNGTIAETVEELIDLRTYFHDILREFPELQKSMQPSIDLIDRLLGPAEVLH